MKRKLEAMQKSGAGHETLVPALIEPGDALHALKDMREDTQLDGEVGEGGRRRNPISGVSASYQNPWRMIQSCCICILYACSSPGIMSLACVTILDNSIKSYHPSLQPSFHDVRFLISREPAMLTTV